MKKRSVSILSGGGGTLLTGTSAQSVTEMSSRIYFGICPTIPLARNAGQTLNPSCSTREKRHREKRGFRLVPLLARAVQGDKFSSLRAAFTMAEILLSLTIIGVVAAITLPSLTGNINERTWNTQRKALYARFSQAIALMPAVNGYGTLKESTDSATGSTSIEDTAAETFITAGLSKVLKINNICDSEHLEDCGITSKLTTLDASQINLPKTIGELNSAFTSALDGRADVTCAYSALDTKAAAFETANGESIVTYYNPNCQPDMNETETFYVQPKICAHFVYDLNGTKGPNTVNKDIGFLTVIYPTDSVVVSPYVHPQDASASVSYDDAARACTNQDPEYRMPNRYELMSMFASRYLIGANRFGSGYNTSSLMQHQNQVLAWRLYTQPGTMSPALKSIQYKLRCVRRD